MSALTNFTSNELAKKDRYEYLTEGKGRKSLFNRGWCYNVKHYFHLVEPSHLEMPEYETHPNYNI
jgi:hypothetical protein